MIPAVMNSGLAGGVPFDPSQLANLVAWYKADSISQGDATPVASWLDSSGSGRNMSAAGSARPTFKTNIQNALPIVRGDGAANIMTSSSKLLFDRTAPLSMFIVMEFTGSGQSAIVSQHTPAGDAHGWDWTFLPSTHNQSILQILKDNTTGISGGGTDNYGAAFHIAEVTFDGSSDVAGVLLYRDGVSDPVASVYENNYTTGAITNDGTFALFADARGGQFTAADVGEVIIYSRLLTAAERYQVESYLRAKWATP